MVEAHSLESLSDRTLLGQFGDLVQQDCEGNAQLLRYIDVIDRRKLWAKQGHPSMFDPAPLSPGRYKLQVTISEAAKDKLEQLQDLLAHQIPNGDPAPIIERALDALWTQVHKRKTGAIEK